MENFFSKSLYTQGLKKLKTVGIGCAVTFAVINALLAFAQSREKYMENGDRLITGGMILPLGVLIIPVTFLLVSFAFSYLNKRCDSDFYHSLPQKRSCIYFSTLASISTWIVGTLVASVLLNVIIWICCGYNVQFLALPAILAGFLASAFAVASICTVCRVITGTPDYFFLYSIGALLAPRFIMCIFTEHLRVTNRTIIIEQTPFKLSSFECSLWFPFFTSFENEMTFFNNVWLISGLFIQAILFFALGLWLYQRRKSELAGQVTGSKKMLFVFRSLAILPILYLDFITLEEFELAAILFFLSLLAHFLFDLIILKNAKKAAKNIPWFFLTFAIAVVLFFSAPIISNVFVANNPKAEEIVSVQIDIPSYEEEKNSIGIFDHSDYSSSGLDAYNKLPVKSQEAISVVTQALNDTVNVKKSGEYRFRIVFKLKNGEEISRRVYFSEDELSTLIAAMKEETDEQIINLPDWKNITDGIIYFYPKAMDIDVTEDIYESFKKEYNALSSYEQAKTEVTTKPDYLRIDVGEKSFRFGISRESFPETFKLLDEIVEKKK
ncbi:MAG: hypothetical protein E7614_08490 [Ruminococcaceae bacterium]|nr:hypothetical protein [Oscillospiraceae bacterium]